MRSRLSAFTRTVRISVVAGVVAARGVAAAGSGATVGTCAAAGAGVTSLRAGTGEVSATGVGAGAAGAGGSTAAIGAAAALGAGAAVAGAASAVMSALMSAARSLLHAGRSPSFMPVSCVSRSVPCNSWSTRCGVHTSRPFCTRTMASSISWASDTTTSMPTTRAAPLMECAARIRPAIGPGSDTLPSSWSRPAFIAAPCVSTSLLNSSNRSSPPNPLMMRRPPSPCEACRDRAAMPRHRAG